MGFRINVNTRTDVAEGLEEKRYLLKVSKIEPWLNDIQEEVGFIVRFHAHSPENTDFLEGDSLDRFSYEAKMLWKVRGFLYAIGIREKKPFEIDSDDLMGRECLGDLTYYVGKGGKKHPNWRYYAPDEAPEPKAPGEKASPKKEEPATPAEDESPF